MSHDSGKELRINEVPQLTCWPGRTKGCKNKRAWAVFHSLDEAIKPFNQVRSVYIGTCTEHLPEALRYDPTALNIVRPY